MQIYKKEKKKKKSAKGDKELELYSIMQKSECAK